MEIRRMQTFIKHPFTYVAITIMIILLLILLFFVVSRFGKTEIDIRVAPSNAEVEIDGRVVSGGVHYLEPGEHLIVVRSEGFGTHEETYTVRDNPETIFVALQPVSREARERVENDEAFREFERFSSEQALEAGDELRSRHPVTERLPYIRQYYRIDYRLDEDILVLEIRADSQSDRDFALDLIERWGYDPDDFTIEQHGLE